MGAAIFSGSIPCLSWISMGLRMVEMWGGYC